MRALGLCSWPLLSLLLAGCAGNSTAHRATPIANQRLAEMGSPYRWRVEDLPGMGNSRLIKELIGTPSPTSADEKLQKDVFATIQKAESAKGFEAPKVLETRMISQTSDETLEVWVVSRGQKRVAYTVSMKPSPTGGTDLRIQGWD